MLITLLVLLLGALTTMTAGAWLAEHLTVFAGVALLRQHSAPPFCYKFRKEAMRDISCGSAATGVASLSRRR